MSRLPVPIHKMAQRLPEQGRIRIGVRKGNAMASIDTFRFTSEDKAALDQIAEAFGGEVKPWQAKGQGNKILGPPAHEVITTTSRMDIILPPDPLGGTPIYELWGGGGLSRRCDGLVCEIPVRGNDGIELEENPCLCVAAGTMSCDVKVRLNVILPTIRLAGTWRVESKSWNAAHELPGMVAAIQSMQAKGWTVGELRIDKEQKMAAGQMQHFVVPRLGMKQSAMEIMAGQSSMTALASGPSVAPVAALAAPAPSPDDEYTDAEIVSVEFKCDECQKVGSAPTDEAAAAMLAEHVAKRCPNRSF